MSKVHQKLPASGPAREALREKGQFWTPQWVSEAMVTYALSCDTDHLFDPAVGAGAFFIAAKVVSTNLGRDIRFLGTEVDRKALLEAKIAGLTDSDLRGVEIRDFVLSNSAQRFSSIVANPPYIRHHRISEDTKRQLKMLAKHITGKALDGRTGYHVFFLIRALERLRVGGRLAFIMPADTCEGVFARTLWKWIFDTYRLDAVVTFSSRATPFPGVDTNAMIFMISAAPPEPTFMWCRCDEGWSTALREWVEGGFPESANGPLCAVRRSIPEGFETGLSRPPQERHVGTTLGDFVRTLRGIASGANEYFFMTRAEAAAAQIPFRYFVRAIGRTRDVEGDEITVERVEALDQAGRPTCLLSLDGSSIEAFPESVRRYLVKGKDMAIHQRALIQQRRPWYKMETRKTPPFLFAYLGRRNARFIRNRAGIVPLTGFLCVYAKREDIEFVEKLWHLLNHEDTIANLALVAKSYGSGAIKVEPRALERVPLTNRALEESGLNLGHEKQCEMAF